MPDFEEPCDDASDGSSNSYNIIVRATDNHGKETDYPIAVTVSDVNERPEFTGTVTTAVTLNEHDATVDENGANEPLYAFPVIAAYTARDEEGGVTWSLAGADRLDFAIDSGGNVTFADTPNFEDPRDSGGNNEYSFNVVATDIHSGTSRRTFSQVVTVAVEDIEETGVITQSNLDPVVGDTLTFTLADPDGGISTLPAEINWDLRARNAMGDWEYIITTPSYATTLTYTVDEDLAGKPLRADVTYFDRRNTDRESANRKSLMSQETAAVLADPAPNVPPRIRSGTSQSIEEGEAARTLDERVIATDRDGDALTFAIEVGVNSDLFEINSSTGQVRATEALDFETTPNAGLLTFTVTVHDGKGVDAADMVITDTTVDASSTMSVRVIDLEEDGVVTFDREEAETGTPLRATLTDGDGGVTGETWQWARSGNGRTGWANIAGATSGTYTPTADDEDFYLRGSVAYEDRRGGGKTAEGITEGAVPSENRRPLFPSAETGQRSIAENTRAGTNIGDPVVAEDPDNDRLTYSLTGADASAFTIVSSTGQIRTSEALDFETKSTYNVTVEVHDGRDSAGNTSTAIDDTQNVAITVANVEEPGAITLNTDTGETQAPRRGDRRT